MSDTQNKFYLTTPIYYVNARPHIGHAYTTIAADVIARRHRLLGDDTFFLTGTDEHGQKIERSAAAAGIPPQQFTDQVAAQFRSLWDRMGITYDNFIRTTDDCHKQAVQHLFTQLYDRGHIYLSTYTGAYCVSDEAFVDLPVGTPCPDCGRLLEEVTEENFFFKLSAFQQPLIDLIESGQLAIQPEVRKNEVLSFVKGGLKDLSISRSSFKWGIPVPAEVQQKAGATQSHIVYVWLDALTNYMSAIGYGSDDPTRQEQFKKYWPADLHLVGKEIIRFHCVYWPAFLMAAGIDLPKAITAHGWLLFEESKMSKSRGNIVRTETILDAFGALCPTTPIAPQNAVILSEGEAESKDPEKLNPATTAQTSQPPSPASLKGTASAVPQTPPSENAALAAEVRTPSKHEQDLFASDVIRYFLLREIPFGQDGGFSFDALVQRYNSDLANGYGNLVSRTLKMIEQYCAGSVPSIPEIRPLDKTKLPEWWTSDPFAIDAKFTDQSPQPDPFLSYGYVTIRDAKNQPGLSVDSELRVHGGKYFYEVNEGLNVYEFFQVAIDPLLRATSTSVWSENLTKFINLISTNIKVVDEFLSISKPWKLASTDPRRNDVLAVAAAYVRIITAALYPILPYATASVWRQLGLGDIEAAAKNGELKDLQWGGLKPGTKLGPLAPIFPRADKGIIEIMNTMEQKPAGLPHVNNSVDKPSQEHTEFREAPISSLSATPALNPLAETIHPITPHVTPETPQIAIDDFVKIDLRVAQVIVAERIPKADKLLRLEVDLGYEKRQILSGIAEWYTPEELIGRKIVIIANLAPRKMRGLESHGMLLAASHGDNGKPVLATFGEDIALGSRLR